MTFKPLPGAAGLLLGDAVRAVRSHVRPGRATKAAAPGFRLAGLPPRRPPRPRDRAHLNSTKGLARIGGQQLPLLPTHVLSGELPLCALHLVPGASCGHQMFAFRVQAGPELRGP